MIRIGNVVAGLATLSLLAACGGGSTSAPPAPVVVSLAPTSVAAVDGGESIPLTATVSPDTGGQSVRWTVTCAAGVASCGAMAQPTSTTGVADNFQADAGATSAQSVTITATSVQDQTKSASIKVPVNPALRTVSPAAVQTAVVGAPFALPVGHFIQGGTPPLTCTVSTGSLPVGLSVVAASATVNGTPAAPQPPMMIGFGCTDSASPPMSLAIELQVSLQILAAPGVVPGAMAYPRIDHTATALPTGLVLVAGGAGSRSAAGEASAELYDPATGVFAPTGAMASARHGHTATPLANGDVLMTGGIGWANSALASTEIYDASTGMFAATGSLGTARAGHSATTLANGRVLLVGGFDVSDNPLASAEIYDPTSGKFAATGSLGTARWGHAAALLGDGRVLIAGGTEYYGAANRVHLATAEIFDPASGQFTPTGAMAEARLALTATAVTGGLVLVTGGLGSNAAPLSSAELYDPATGRFAPTGSMAAARGGHTATLRADGSVLVVGGDSLYRSDPYICNGRIGCGELVLWPTERVEVFSPATGTFATSRPLSLQRAFHTATLLPSGAVLVTGGAVVAYGGYHQAFRHFITITAESAL